MSRVPVDQRRPISLNPHPHLNSASTKLEHFHIVDGPIRRSKRSRIFTHIILTRRRQTSTTTTRPYIPRPIPTKRRVENDILVHERIVNRTSIPTIERHHRKPPICQSKVTALVGDVRGYGSAREKPDVYSGRFPLHGIDASAVGIETVAV